MTTLIACLQTSVQNSGHVLRVKEQKFKRLVVGGTEAVSGQELRLADARVELVSRAGDKQAMDRRMW